MVWKWWIQEFEDVAYAPQWFIHRSGDSLLFTSYYLEDTFVNEYNLDRVLLLWVWNLRDLITMFIYPLVVSCIRRASWAGGAAKSLDGSGSCSPTPTAETWWVAKIRRILIDAWNIFIPLFCYLYSYFVFLPSSHFHAGRLPRPQFVVRIRGALLWRLD